MPFQWRVRSSSKRFRTFTQKATPQASKSTAQFRLLTRMFPLSPLQLRQVLSPRQSAMLLRLSQEVQKLFLFVQTPVQENSRTVLRIMLSKFRIQTSFLCRLQRLFRSRFLLITHQSTEVLIPISQRTLLSRLL